MNRDSFETKKKLPTIALFALTVFVYLGALYPVLFYPIVADDLTNPFAQYIATSGNLMTTIQYGFNGGWSHHFNFIGTTIGSLVNYVWILSNAHTEIGHIGFYLILKSLAYLSLSFALSEAIRNGSALFDRSPKSMPNEKLAYFALSSFGIVAFVQIHALWSNDPVASYPTSGIVSTAIGLAALSLLTRALSLQSIKHVFLSLAVMIVAIFYYELNVALVPATFVLLILHKLYATRTQGVGDLKFYLSSGALLVLVPTLVAVAARLMTQEDAVNYGGTTVGSLQKFPSTFTISGLSNLPGSAWKLSSEVSGVLSFAYRDFLLVLGCLAVLFIVASVSIQQIRLRDKQISGVACVTAFLFTYMLFATAIQALTAKYQDEITRIGKVYNFYITGLVFSVAVLMFILFVYAKRSAGVANVVLVGVLTFGIFQAAINLTLFNVAKNGTTQSQVLLSSIGDQSTDIDRCAAWYNWSAIGWPEYYEVGMGVGLQAFQERYFGVPFCSQGVNFAE